MTPQWQILRSTFNHDWLKNRYLNRIDGFAARIRAGVANEERIVRFLNEDFPDWEARRDQIQTLLATFRPEMSPKVMFEQEPLNRCDSDTVKWLGQLVDGLWAQRYNIDTLLRTVEAAFIEADSEYENIRGSIRSKEGSNKQTVCVLLQWLPVFGALCKKLSDSISALPSRINIT